MSDELREAAKRALEDHRADIRREVAMTGEAAEGGAGCWCHDLQRALSVPALSGDSGPGLREAVLEYLAADAAMPEFADAQRLDPAEWDRRNRRWAAADVALRAALAAAPVPDQPRQEDGLRAIRERVAHDDPDKWPWFSEKEVRWALVSAIVDRRTLLAALDACTASLDRYERLVEQLHAAAYDDPDMGTREWERRLDAEWQSIRSARRALDGPAGEPAGRAAMSGPQTEAGKALRNWLEWAGAKAKLAGVPSETLIAAIEREAVRAYKAELAAQLDHATDVGVYPASSPEGPCTPWQDGWNAGAAAVEDAVDALLAETAALEDAE